jgi:hypothetical protein
MRQVAGILVVVSVLTAAAVPSAAAADLRDETRLAYEAYAARAIASFLQRFSSAAASPGLDAADEGETRVRPAAEDGVISVTGGLVHHWAGSAFIPGVTLDDAIAVSQAYGEYPDMYKEIVSSRMLAHEGNTYRVRFRIRESAMGRTAVLEITSHVTYAFPRAGAASSVATADEIREVVESGTPGEHYLPAGRDSGYLWRASTLTGLIARDRGVDVTMETIGLSRGFPAMLGWIIEPVARRLGIKSVERSLQEFRDAVRARKETATGKTSATVPADSPARSPAPAPGVAGH